MPDPDKSNWDNSHPHWCQVLDLLMDICSPKYAVEHKLRGHACAPQMELSRDVLSQLSYVFFFRTLGICGFCFSHNQDLEKSGNRASWVSSEMSPTVFLST